MELDMALEIINNELGRANLKEKIWDQGSLIYTIELNNKEYVMKIKKSRKPEDRRIALVEAVTENEVKVPKILLEKHGLVVKEKIEGISLFAYLKTLDDPYSNKNIDSNLLLICEEFGRYMRKFHESIKHINARPQQKTNIESEIRRAIVGVDDTLKDYYEYMINYAQTTRIESTGILHGDFHNFSNIMIKHDGYRWGFESLIDYDTIQIGNIYDDLAQILRHIFVRIPLGADPFLKGYSKNIEDKAQLIQGITSSYVYEIVDTSTTSEYKEVATKFMEETVTCCERIKSNRINKLLIFKNIDLNKYGIE